MPTREKNEKTYNIPAQQILALPRSLGLLRGHSWQLNGTFSLSGAFNSKVTVVALTPHLKAEIIVCSCVNFLARITIAIVDRYLLDVMAFTLLTFICIAHPPSTLHFLADRLEKTFELLLGG